MYLVDSGPGRCAAGRKHANRYSICSPACPSQPASPPSAACRLAARQAPPPASPPTDRLAKSLARPVTEHRQLPNYVLLRIVLGLVWFLKYKPPRQAEATDLGCGPCQRVCPPIRVPAPAPIQRKALRTKWRKPKAWKHLQEYPLACTRLPARPPAQAPPANHFPSSGPSRQRPKSAFHPPWPPEAPWS